MNVAEYIFKTLEDYGVEDVFYLPGGGCLFLVDALSKSKINPVCMAHEHAAAIATEAYAQYKNDIGVLLITTGPGVTNSLTGVTAAFLDSIPIIVLSGQVPTNHRAFNYGVRQYGIQEVPTEQLVKSIVKKYFYIGDIKKITMISEAINLATSGRPGPCWVDIPLNVQKMEVEYK
jgi:acetolactate synthase-1/2/3 large subunit